MAKQQDEGHSEHQELRPLRESDVQSAKAGKVALLVLVLGIAFFVGGLLTFTFEMVFLAFPAFALSFIMGLIIYFVSKRTDKAALWASILSLLCFVGFAWGLYQIFVEALSKT